MKEIVLLGSTGSIGTQTLEVIKANREDYQVEALACGSNIVLLAEQILEFNPTRVCVGDDEGAESLRGLLNDRNIKDKDLPEILVGDQGLETIVRGSGDMVINALVGIRGLIPTLKAIECGKDIALANKETLVAGGHIVMEAVKNKGIKILPIDSEHSAIFQCLEGNKDKGIRRILLTASGGPFRGWSQEELDAVTPEMALKHPNWTMGKKITIDSATMMNKGLEIIEARWLFDVDVNNIRVVVHPQSIIHSAVEFEDTAILAQLGTPDMRVPISVALGYPERIPLAKEDIGVKELDIFGTSSNLTFEEPDRKTFRCLDLAVQAINQGGTYPAVLNGANEVLVEKFLNKEIGFPAISEGIEKTMEAHHPVADDLEGILEADRWARKFVEDSIKC